MNIIRMSSDDLVPAHDSNYVDVGLLALLDDLSYGDPLILKGPKGSGKTLAAEQWCSQNGVPMVRENCNSGTDESNLIGSFGMQGEDVVFSLGALPLAIETANDVGACVLVLEEVNTLRPQVQSTIFSVADYRKSVEASFLGRRFELAADSLLWVLGTMNPGYSGTYQLNEALRSRFDFVEVLYMPEKKERELLESTFTTPPDVKERRIAAGLLQFAAESRTHDWTYALSTRDLVNTVHKYEKVGLDKALKILADKFDPEHRSAIAARVQSVFAINLQEVSLYGS
jgi:MoxR-like ATPase